MNKLMIAAIALAMAGVVQAGEVVYLTKGDTSMLGNKNSFHLGDNWSDEEPPHGDADYLVDLGPGKYMRTNGQAWSDTFAGRSLTFGNAVTNAAGWLYFDLARPATISNAFLVKGGFYIPSNTNWRRYAGSNTVVSTASAPFAFVSNGGAEFKNASVFVGAEDAVFVIRPSSGATSLASSFIFLHDDVTRMTNYRGKIIVEGTNVSYSAIYGDSKQMPTTWLGDQPATLLPDAITLRNGGGLSVSSNHTFPFAAGTRGITVGAGGGTLAWKGSGHPFSAKFAGEGVLRVTGGALFHSTTIACGGVSVRTNAHVRLHENVVWGAATALEVKNGGTLTTPSKGLRPVRTRLETGARIICGVAHNLRYWNNGTLMLYRNAGNDVGTLELTEGSVLDLNNGPLKLRLEDERVKGAYLGRIPVLKVPTSVRTVTPTDFKVERTAADTNTGQAAGTIDRIVEIETVEGIQTVYLTLPKSYVAPPNTPGVDPAEPYDTWTTAATNLADGVAYAVANNRNLNVKPGLYNLTATLTVSKPICVRSDDGTGRLATETAILDGGSTPGNVTAGIRPVTLSVAGASIQGFTIRNGCSSSAGGGVLMSVYGTAVIDCVITNCVATNSTDSAPGGGIRVTADQADILRTTIVGCRATNGGGISLSGNRRTAYGSKGAYCRVVGCKILDNEAVRKDQNATGGGICTGNYGPCWAEDCFFKGNWTTTTGGGGSSNRRGAAMELSPYAVVTNCVFDRHGSAYRSIVDGGPVKVTHCVFRNLTSTSGNIVGDGNKTDSIVENCVFTNNSAQILYGDAHLKNCLFAYNTAPLNTGSSLFENCSVVTNTRGFHIAGGGNKPVFINCISAWNGNQSVSNVRGWNNFCFIWQARTNNVTVSNCCFQGVTKWVNDMTGMDKELWSMPTLDPTGCSITVDPKMVDPLNGNARLKLRSPCRDTGILRDGMANDIDLDGNPRVVTNGKPLAERPDARPDMGCYEIQESRPGFLIIVR